MSLKTQKDTLWYFMKHINSCLKFTILERCLHYLMIASRDGAGRAYSAGASYLFGLE